MPKQENSQTIANLVSMVDGDMIMTIPWNNDPRPKQNPEKLQQMMRVRRSQRRNEGIQLMYSGKCLCIWFCVSETILGVCVKYYKADNY